MSRRMGRHGRPHPRSLDLEQDRLFRDFDTSTGPLFRNFWKIWIAAAIFSVVVTVAIIVIAVLVLINAGLL